MVLGIFAGVGDGVLISLSFIISGSGYCTVGLGRSRRLGPPSLSSWFALSGLAPPSGMNDRPETGFPCGHSACRGTSLWAGSLVTVVLTSARIAAVLAVWAPPSVAGMISLMGDNSGPEATDLVGTY